jgi:ABC-type amino acid transport system permease subunit
MATDEEEKEKIYKMYLEAYGKNGVSKIIMKTMIGVMDHSPIALSTAPVPLAVSVAHGTPIMLIVFNILLAVRKPSSTWKEPFRCGSLIKPFQPVEVLGFSK